MTTTYRPTEQQIFDAYMDGFISLIDSQILSVRFGFSDGKPMDLWTAADLFECSRQEIRRREAKAMATLRKIYNEGE